MDRRRVVRSLLIAATGLMAVACGGGAAVPAQDSSADASSTVVGTPETPPTEVTSPASSTWTPATGASTSTTSDSVVGPSTSSEVTPPVPPDGPVVLRPDGLGPYAFLTPRSEVEPWLTGELGPPVSYEVEGPMLVTCGAAGCEGDGGALVAGCRSAGRALGRTRSRAR